MACAWYAWQQRREAARAELGSIYKQSEKRAWDIVQKVRTLIEIDCIEAVRQGVCPHRKVDCAQCSLRTSVGEGNHGGWCRRGITAVNYATSCVKHPNWDKDIEMSGACHFDTISEDMKGDAAYPDCPVVAKWAGIKDRASRLWMAQLRRGSGKHFERCIETMAGPEPGLEQYSPELADPMFQAKALMEDRTDYHMNEGRLSE